MKNADIVPFLNGIAKIEGLKLGGLKLKTILKNKRELIKAHEDLENLKKKIVEQYTEDGVFNETEANKEWSTVMFSPLTNKIDAVFVVGELDQFKDLTLEQYEILDLMCEKKEVAEEVA